MGRAPLVFNVRKCKLSLSLFLHAHGASLRIKNQLLVFCSSDLNPQSLKFQTEKAAQTDASDILRQYRLSLNLTAAFTLIRRTECFVAPYVHSLCSTGLFLSVPSSECSPSPLCAQLLGMLARLFQRQRVLSSPMIENN